MIHAEARAPHLAVLRIAVFGIWFVTIAQLRVSQFALIPPELVDPPGLLGSLPMAELFARPNLMELLRVVALAGCALAVLGVRPFPVVAVPTVVVLFVLDGAMKSIGGFTNHAQTAALYSAGVLALFPAGDAWSIRRRPAPARSSPWLHRTPLLVASLVITAAYTMIGLRRLVDGGISLVTGPSMEVWLVSRSLEYGRYPFDEGLLVLDHRWLLPVVVAGLVTTTVGECLSLVTLRVEWFRRLWLVMIVPFHVATLFAMRIFFWENLVLILVLLTRLPHGLVRLVEGRATRYEVSDPPDGDDPRRPSRPGGGASRRLSPRRASPRCAPGASG